jgi:high-affinity Fe2+/Pb2+ permease
MDQLQEDWLDARLREEASYIDDAGFTASVVQKLPAGRRSSSSGRAIILIAVTIVACVVAYLVSGRGEFLANFAAFLLAMPLTTVCAIAGFCAIAVMAVSAYAAVAKTRELRS